jgi:hypothetical protein
VTLKDIRRQRYYRRFYRIGGIPVYTKNALTQAHKRALARMAELRFE